MTTHNQRLGRAGEDVAAAYLRSIGHRILEKNWRSEFGELDLISSHAGQLIAIEVKTRSSDKYGTAFEAIGEQKLRRIRRLMIQWARMRQWRLAEIRVDVICVYPEPDTWRIEHYRRVYS